jgi:RimJ/RimL family protein N-acetyltransferase
MILLTTPGLLLEPITPDHADELFGLLSDPLLYRYLDQAPPPSLAHLRSVYARRQAGAPADSGETWFNWVMRLPSGEAAGYVQATLTQDAARATAWVAWVLGRAHWGHGHTLAAAQAMVQHLASQHRVVRFLATVEVDNARSVALLHRMGFVPATPQEALAHALTPTERLYTRFTHLPVDAP